MTLPEKPETAAGQEPAGKDAAGQPAADQPATEPPTVAQLAEGYAAKAGLHRSGNGNIDVLKSAGGIQGIAESILPGLVFLVAFTITRELPLALIFALAVAAVFTLTRLVQRKPLTQALAGIAGVGLSAWLANSTGKAEDFYVLGFFTNAGYIVGMAISIAVRWPFAGLIFGFIRNEGLDWRKNPARVKAYQIGTWVIIAVLVLRLLVQVPLYFMGDAGFAALAVGASLKYEAAVATPLLPIFSIVPEEACPIYGMEEASISWRML